MSIRVPPATVGPAIFPFIVSALFAWPMVATAQGLNGTYSGRYRCGQSVTRLTGTITGGANCVAQLEREQETLSRSRAAVDQAKKALDDADREAEKADQAFANPVLKWALVTKRDRGVLYARQSWNGEVA